MHLRGKILKPDKNPTLLRCLKHRRFSAIPSTWSVTSQCPGALVLKNVNCTTPTGARLCLLYSIASSISALRTVILNLIPLAIKILFKRLNCVNLTQNELLVLKRDALNDVKESKLYIAFYILFTKLFETLLAPASQKRLDLSNDDNNDESHQLYRA